MRLESILHRSAFTDCYALDHETVVLNLRTGKDVEAVSVIHEDPYSSGLSIDSPWKGIPVKMNREKELARAYIWSVRLKPEFKREQYYFEISGGGEKIYMMEDDFYTKEQLKTPGRMKQYFKFPWLNSADICQPPAWAADTIWYQIMPDRFCRGDESPKSVQLKDWNDRNNMSHSDFYGGDLRGIISRLEYLKELGISGIYLTPVFESGSNHKYNTFDYKKIDPDFGSGEDMRELLRKAHSLGIRVMLDAVFNHCGVEFPAWKDVLEKGEDSRYFDWFFVNGELKAGDYSKTKDGRYYSFAFEAYMPKLNTNNPEVMDYFTEICRYWVEEWGIDGIRFDVGNEISHAFIKKLHRELKAVNKEIFLLGEIWHDSVQWLQGDEYDSVMNYPFLESMNEFWVEDELEKGGKMDSTGFMYGMNRCYCLYPEQVNQVLFNFLDTHDIERAYSRCQNIDILLQQLVILMSMPGSPCLYYGTEIAMSGTEGVYNRKTMPWDEIESRRYNQIIGEVRKIIALRNTYPHMKSSQIQWKHEAENRRLIHYVKYLEVSSFGIEVYLNGEAGKVPVESRGNVIYSGNYDKGYLQANGILINKVTL